MARSEFKEEIREFEDILQKVAGEIASGMLSEKLPPSELLKKAENHMNRLRDLATTSQETMLVLKAERTPTVPSKCENFIQTLATFRDILLQNTTDPPANSRLAFEQLKKALTDDSDLLFFMREVRDAPSPLISAALAFKKASEAKGSVISIRASEDVQPLIEYMLDRIDEFNAVMVSLEKKVTEMNQIARELEEKSLKILATKASAQSMKYRGKPEKKQLSLSNFKAEGKVGDNSHVND